MTKSESNALDTEVQGLKDKLSDLDYDDFLTNLNAYPAEAGGKEIRAFLSSNPNLAFPFKNLQTDARAIRTLDDELMGINRRDEENVYDKFVTNILLKNICAI